MSVSKEAKRAFNQREKGAYHEYISIHGKLKGGQKTFRQMMRERPISERPRRLLGKRQRETLDRVLRQVSIVRRGRGKLSGSEYKGQPGTTKKTVVRYLGLDWKREDRAIRQMNIIENGRVVPIEVSSSVEASKVGNYWNAVARSSRAPSRTAAAGELGGVDDIVIDSKGVKHALDQNPESVHEALRRSESEAGVFEIYDQGAVSA
jgi:hypothetical protein